MANKQSKNKPAQQQPKGEKQVTPPKAKVQKPKGPAPTSYQPNHKRLQTRMIQERQTTANMKLEAAKANFRLELQAAKRRLPDLAAGALGNYMVGNEVDGVETIFGFVLRMHSFPATATKPEQELPVIQEARPMEGTHDCVFVPHTWLFKNPKKFSFAHGKIGVVQAKMLAYLKTAMSEEIAVIKAARTEAAKPRVDGMERVDAEHALEIGDTSPAPAPITATGGNVFDIMSMSTVNEEHRQELLAA
jgi:hypothetical protein